MDDKDIKFIRQYQIDMTVVGITGADEKVDLLKSRFHFDQAVNYKTAGNLKEAIGNACPAGVDVYFDNVGGEISDAVLANINKNDYPFL